MITMRYLGNKKSFTLTLPFLSRQYYVEGPGASVLFRDNDATQMMAQNPKMFRVEGIVTDDAPAETKQAKPETNAAPAETKPAEDDTPPSEQAQPKLVLTGDGVEGTADEEIPIAVLMTYKEEELRTYAMQRFGHQFTDADKRNPMIKKIKELEQKKAQAGK